MDGSGAWAGLADVLVSGGASDGGFSPPAGAAVALWSNEVRQEVASGFSSVATPTTIQTALTVDTAHDLASVTKVVATTASLMTLVSHGAVRLDDTVGRYLPGFRVGTKSRVTIRDLLTHRGGLWEWWPLYIATPDAEHADQLTEQLDLRYEPGQGRHYSDLGFMLLGRIVAAVATRPLDEAVAELVTRPLGMANTHFSHPHHRRVAMSSFGDGFERAMVDSGTPYPVPFRAAEFDSWRTNAVSGDVNDGNAFHCFGGVSGHAGLFSDIADLVRFGRALSCAEHHTEHWHPDVVAEFFAPGPDAEQALGFRRYPFAIGDDTVTLLGHIGFVGCAVGFVPGRDVAVAMATNRLVTDGVPTPTDTLWNAVTAAASDALDGRSA